MRPKREPLTPGQESVWDYPRPAIVEATDSHILIRHAGVVVADTRAALRTLETSHPPTYYIPVSDVSPGLLRHADGTSFCEWKGRAIYWDVLVGSVVLARVGWSYPAPTAPFKTLRHHIAFYAGPFDHCGVDGETVTPQAGPFYGGWITSRLAGPFKGVPGSLNW